MEGIGYWIFLIIIYALASYLRKKQRKQAVENKDGESQPDSKPRTTQADFLRQIFGEIEKEIIPERKDVLLEDEIPFEEETESSEFIHEGHKPLPVAPVAVEEKAPDVSPKVRDSAFQKPGYASEVKSNRRLGMLKSILKESDSLRKSIILKEILDKPRALRHSIR